MSILGRSPLSGRVRPAAARIRTWVKPVKYRSSSSVTWTAVARRSTTPENWRRVRSRRLDPKYLAAWSAWSNDGCDRKIPSPGVTRVRRRPVCRREPAGRPEHPAAAVRGRYAGELSDAGEGQVCDSNAPLDRHRVEGFPATPTWPRPRVRVARTQGAARTRSTPPVVGGIGVEGRGLDPNPDGRSLGSRRLAGSESAGRPATRGSLVADAPARTRTEGSTSRGS